eukprot:CAMPEP_0185535474 /NCGR_PEP_ID=MMETSP1366-20130426/109459_1 /TAXON_ID=38817 /ORGANISM="Gephyrocapsa oceanica, Strain RCC1303" /LENGTH=422 /DNA_ID=CAMNT_0028147195 /DNA_START=31 /DNA_END=1298 /DNA_ORIENTATION=-
MRRLPLSDLSPLSQHHLPPRQPPAQGGGALEPAHVALVVRRRVRVHRPVQVEQPITLRARHASRTPASRVEVDQLAPRPVRVPSQNLEGASAALATEREGSGAQQRHLRAEQARHGVGAIDKGLRPHPPHRGAAELAVETGGGSVREGEHLCGRVLRRRVATGARQQAGAEQRHRQRAAEAVAAQGEPLTRTDAELRLDHLAQLLPRWTDQSSYGVSVSSSPSRRSSAAAAGGAQERAAEAVAAQGEPLTRTDAELRLDHLAQLLGRRAGGAQEARVEQVARAGRLGRSHQVVHHVGERGGAAEGHPEGARLGVARDQPLRSSRVALRREADELHPGAEKREASLDLAPLLGVREPRQPRAEQRRLQLRRRQPLAAVDPRQAQLRPRGVAEAVGGLADPAPPVFCGGDRRGQQCDAEHIRAH